MKHLIACAVPIGVLLIGSGMYWAHVNSKNAQTEKPGSTQAEAKYVADIDTIRAIRSKPEEACGWFTKYSLIRELTAGEAPVNSELFNLSEETIHGLAVSLTIVLKDPVRRSEVCQAEPSFLYPNSPASEYWKETYGENKLTLSRKWEVAYRISLLKKDHPEWDSEVADYKTLRKAVLPFAVEFGPQLAHEWLYADKGEWGHSARVLKELIYDWQVKPIVLGLGDPQAIRLQQLENQLNR